jgi:hypothetical protein
VITYPIEHSHKDESSRVEGMRLAVKENIYIISDLQINMLSIRKRDGVIKFLNDVVGTKATSLYLVGDVIDLQVKDMNEEAVEALWLLHRTIADLTSAGLKVTWLLGNHDILLQLLMPPLSTGQGLQIDYYNEREPFELAQNLTLSYRSTRFEYMGKIVHLEHGHIYDLGWVPAPELENVVPLSTKRFVADDWVSNALDLYEAFGSYQDDYPARLLRTGLHLPPTEYARMEAKRLARDGGFDWVILGHFHAPSMEELGDEKIYANSGDSLHHGSYIVLTDGEMRVGDWREIIYS